MNLMPPKACTRVMPPGGWRESTYYIVEAAFSASNPVHRYIFFSGFLDSRGFPAGYNCILSATIESRLSYGDTHYIRAVHRIGTEEIEGITAFDFVYNMCAGYNPSRKELDE